MLSFLRTLAFPIACAFTGAAAGLLTVRLAAPPAATCPQGPVLELKQVATALAAMQVVPSVPPAPPPAPAAAPFPGGAVRHIGGGYYAVDREALVELFNNPAQFDRQARILPSVRDGVTQGFKVYGLRPGSLPNLLGLKNGDLLVAINGARLASFNEFAALRRQLPSAESVALDVVRKGEPLRISMRLE